MQKNEISISDCRGGDSEIFAYSSRVLIYGGKIRD